MLSVDCHLTREGYIGQLLGLLTTTASRSCVICSLHCVFVAVVAALIRVSRSPAGSSGAKFDYTRLAPAALAVAGVAVVELQGAAGAPTIGDALSFAQPVGFGMGYLQLEDLMRRQPEAALPVSAIKLTIIALASLCYFELGPLLDVAASSGELWIPRVPDFGAIVASPVALGGVLWTGIVTTAIALWIESIAFARVPATDASIILTTEPLFAAAFSAVSLGETFGTSDYVGASLIVGACVIAVLLDNPGDEECIIEEDPTCVPERKWPFWGF
jgi:drug/metabolite transporter (DMT)-like permease